MRKIQIVAIGISAFFGISTWVMAADPVLREDKTTFCAIRSLSSGGYLDGRETGEKEALVSSAEWGDPRIHSYYQWQITEMVPSEVWSIKSVSSTCYLDGRHEGGHAAFITLEKPGTYGRFLQWRLEELVPSKVWAIKSLSSDCYLDGRHATGEPVCVTGQNPTTYGKFLQWEIIRLTPSFEIRRDRFDLAMARNNFFEAWSMRDSTEQGLMWSEIAVKETRKYLKQLTGESVFQDSAAKLAEARAIAAAFPAEPRAELDLFIAAEEAAARATLARLSPDAAARTAALRSVADRLFG